MSSRKRLFLSVLLANLILFGCQERPRQEDFEYEVASQMATALHWGQLQNGTNQFFWLSNRLQLLPMMSTQYLAGVERKFLTYGRSGGLTNSFLEKYLLLPPGVVGSPPELREIMLASASPLKRRNGRLERVIVHRWNSRFWAGWIAEGDFRASLARAQIELSTLQQHETLPSLRHLWDPTGARERSWREFDEEVEKGQRQRLGPFWKRPAFLYGTVAVLGLLVLFVLWRRDSKRNPYA